MAIFTLASASDKRSISKPYAVAANYGFSQPTEYSFGQMSSKTTIFDSIVPPEGAARNDLFRTIYSYDSVSGAAVDLMSVLPFSDYIITGESDKAVLRIFEDTCTHLNVRTIMPQLCVEYLTIGKLIGSLVYNDNLGIFTDLIVQDPNFCTIEPIPMQGYDPKVDLQVSPEFRKFLLSTDPRDLEAKRELSETMKRKTLSGKVPLDPLTTVYVARKTYPRDTGTSYLSRIVPFFMLEQLLLAGTLTGAQRQQRPIMHIKLENDPSPTDLENATELFNGALMDPTGPIIATRDDVSVETVGSPQDFWKVTDEWDGLTQAKLRSLGINESFLCLAKGSLIPTEKGLLKIEDIYPQWKDLDKDTCVDIDLTVKGFEGTAKAARFYYRGKGPVSSIRTTQGYCLNATDDHKVLTIGQEMKPEWVKIKDLTQGQYIFIDRRQNIINVKSLALDLKAVVEDPINPITLKPEMMTPDLAYILGSITVKGVVTQNTIRIFNKNSDVIDSLAATFRKVFGKQIAYTVDSLTEPIGLSSHYLEIESANVTQWLLELGGFATLPEEIPWSVLQADKESQLSFIASLMDSQDDILINEGVISQCYPVIKEQLITMITNLGFVTTVMPHRKGLCIKVLEGQGFYKAIRLYMCLSQGLPPENSTTFIIGVPTYSLGALLSSRQLEKGRYMTDIGMFITVTEDRQKLLESLPKILTYTEYKGGAYNELLEAVKSISFKTGSRLETLLKYEYYFDTYDHKLSGEEDHLFDLGIAEGSIPAFQASGIITHNSGDATYNCVTGDTLIPIEGRGLQRIDKLADVSKGTLQDLDTNVGALMGWERNKKWLYQGKAPCIRIETKLGFALEATPKHPILIAEENGLTLKPTGNLRIGDRVCIPRSKTVRTTPLKFKVPFHMLPKEYGSKPALPKCMVPDLAFIIGLIVAKGSVTKGIITVYHTDESIIAGWKKICKSLFGLEPVSMATKSNIAVNNGIRYSVSSSDLHYESFIQNVIVSNFMKSIGVYENLDEIPWSILQADEKSQLAFLAGCLEANCDLYPSTIKLHTYSSSILKQLQILLQSHGIIASALKYNSANGGTLIIAHRDAYTLYQAVKDYFVSNKKDLELTKCEMHTALTPEPWMVEKTYRHLQKIGMCFTPITKLDSLGDKDMYDISMQDNTSHIFIGNGMLQRQTMESALSVFIEQLRTFRLYMTQKIFYHKIFPTLARARRLIKRTPAELDHGIRITGTQHNPSDIPYKDLIIPEVAWHKQLQPQYDESHLSILSTLQDMGLPVTIRTLAASGGYAIEKLLNSLDEDLENRRLINEYQKKLKKIGGDSGGEEEAGWSVGLGREPRKRHLPEVLPAISKALSNKRANKMAEQFINDNKQFLRPQDSNASGIVAGKYGVDNDPDPV